MKTCVCVFLLVVFLFTGCESEISEKDTLCLVMAGCLGNINTKLGNIEKTLYDLPQINTFTEEEINTLCDSITEEDISEAVGCIGESNCNEASIQEFTAQANQARQFCDDGCLDAPDKIKSCLAQIIIMAQGVGVELTPETKVTDLKESQILALCDAIPVESVTEAQSCLNKITCELTEINQLKTLLRQAVDGCPDECVDSVSEEIGACLINILGNAQSVGITLNADMDASSLTTAQMIKLCGVISVDDITQADTCLANIACESAYSKISEIRSVLSQASSGCKDDCVQNVAGEMEACLADIITQAQGVGVTLNADMDANDLTTEQMILLCGVISADDITKADKCVGDIVCESATSKIKEIRSLLSQASGGCKQSCLIDSVEKVTKCFDDIKSKAMGLDLDIGEGFSTDNLSADQIVQICGIITEDGVADIEQCLSDISKECEVAGSQIDQILEVVTQVPSLCEKKIDGCILTAMADAYKCVEVFKEKAQGLDVDVSDFGAKDLTKDLAASLCGLIDQDEIDTSKKCLEDVFSDCASIGSAIDGVQEVVDKVIELCAVAPGEVRSSAPSKQYELSTLLGGLLCLMILLRQIK